MIKIYINCLRCGKFLTGKQQKYCSKLCLKKDRQKRYKQKKWKIINAKSKTRKIENKIRRKILVEQEKTRRKELIKNKNLI